MKCILCHSEPDGGVTEIPCYGSNEKELDDDINLTMERLNWNKQYCYLIKQ